MDISSSSLMRNPKSLKLSLDQNVSEGGSRICSLPEAILCKILSVLPTKAAVRTSILSKRWQFLWRSITRLVLEEGFEDRTRRAGFLNFVERTLLLRDSSNLQTFSLQCHVLSDGSRINTWIQAAVRHKVQMLNLKLCFQECNEPFMLPGCLFTCESLEALDLDFFYDLKVPSFICFPNLKVLTLSMVIFPDQHSVQQLLFGCPSLTRLLLLDCEWDNVKAVYLSAPMLEEVGIIEDRTDCHHLPGCQFIISGMRLKQFCYHGILKNDYFIDDAPSLVEAFVHVDGMSIEEQGRQIEAAYRAHKLLKGLANKLNKLCISQDSLHVLNYAEELDAHFPLFYNLKLMDVYKEPMDLACRGLLNILRNSPHLESLTFVNGICLSDCGMGDVRIFDSVPACFLTHLKTIKIREFYATEEELHLVKSLLESATGLEKLWLFSNGEMKRIYDLILSTIPKASMSSKIGLYC